MPHPTSPVLSSDAPEIKLAEGQPQYQVLPVIAGNGPFYPVTSRYTFTPEERERIAAGGDIWITLLTFNERRTTQPIMVWAHEPALEQITDINPCLSPPRGLGCAPADGEAVHIHLDGSWWFWDETWCNEIGPYATKELASEDMAKYARSL